MLEIWKIFCHVGEVRENVDFVHPRKKWLEIVHKNNKDHFNEHVNAFYFLYPAKF